MIEKASNSNEEFENEMSDLVRCSITFSIFHGIQFSRQWADK